MTHGSPIAVPVRCIGALLGVLLMTSVHAASFNCNNAASFSEKAVCRDSHLSALDDTLASRYATAYATAVDKRAIAAVRDHEWRWRQTHCRDNGCVQDWYQRRIAELEADIVSSAGANATVASSPIIKSENGMVKTKRTLGMTTSVSGSNAASLSHSAGTAVGESEIKVEKVNLTQAPVGPLPPNFQGRPKGVMPIGVTGRFIDTVTGNDILPLPPTNWASVPALPSPTSTTDDSPGLRLINKGGRTTARTVGIFVGF